MTPAEVVEKASKLLSEAWKTKAGAKSTTVCTLEYIPGKVWGKIARVQKSSDGTVHDRSAYGFIKDGLLWKADSWKVPAKNKARGKLEELLDKKNLEGRWFYSIS